MKKLIFVLIFIATISIFVCIYIAPQLTLWTAYGQNNTRNAIVFITTFTICKPLAYITVKISEFIPD